MAENLDYLYKNPTPGINNNQGEIDTSWIGQMDPNKLFQQPGTPTPTGDGNINMDVLRQQQQQYKEGTLQGQFPEGQGGNPNIDTSWIGKLDQKQDFGVKGGQPSDIDTSWIGTGEGLKPQSMQQPEQKPVAPNQGDFVFGKDAEMRNQQNPEYIIGRNQKIINAIKGNMNTQNMSDEQIKSVALDTIKGLGGDISNPQMQSTIQNITNNLRSSAPQYKSDDYFKMLVSNQPITATKGPDVADAYLRFQNFNKFSTFNKEQIADSINSGQLLIGSKARKDLQSAGYGQQLSEATKLQGLKTTNGINSYLIGAMNVDKDASLESQTAEPIQTPNYEKSIAQAIFQGMQTDTVGDFKKYVSENQDIVKARDNARGTREKMDALNLNLRNLADDVKAQIIAGGGVATEGYLQALISEKSKPIIRQFEKLQAEYNSQTAVLSDLTDNSKLEFQYMQQDKENKMKGLQFLQGMYDKEQERGMKQQEMEYQRQQDERKFGLEEKKMGFDQKLAQQKFGLDKEQFAFEKQKFAQGQVSIEKDASGNPIIVNKTTGKASQLVLPGQIQTSTGVHNLKDLGNKDAQTIKEGLIQFGDANTGLVYQWGGDGKNGIDCSGLLMAFGQASGIIPAGTDMTASTMYSKSQPKELNALSGGDLVYYSDSKGGITHVGIALGPVKDGKMQILDASTDLGGVGRRTISVDENGKLKGTNFTIKGGSNFLTDGSQVTQGGQGQWNPQFETLFKKDSDPTIKELAELGLSYMDYVIQKTAFQKDNPGVGKPVSGDASKLIGFASAGSSDISKLLEILKTKSARELYGMKVAGDPRIMSLFGNIIDAKIRLRSGGAATPDEISSFIDQVLPASQLYYNDKASIIESLNSINSEFQGNLSRMGAGTQEPQEGGDTVVMGGITYKKGSDGLYYQQ